VDCHKKNKKRNVEKKNATMKKEKRESIQKRRKSPSKVCTGGAMDRGMLAGSIRPKARPEKGGVRAAKGGAAKGWPKREVSMLQL